MVDNILYRNTVKSFILVSCFSVNLQIIIGMYDSGILLCDFPERKFHNSQLVKKQLRFERLGFRRECILVDLLTS